MKRIQAWLLRLCYQLQNHYFFEVSLRNWLWFWLILPPALSILNRLPWWKAAVASLLVGLALIGIEIARRRGYLLFERAPLERIADPVVPIEVDETIPGWASGTFGVEGKEKYIVHHRAHLSFVRTREHVVMACVKRTRFLLLATSHESDVGWWYVFLKPDQIQKIETGHIWNRGKALPGLALTYLPGKDSSLIKILYLAFADVGKLGRILADLHKDVPDSAFSDS